MVWYLAIALLVTWFLLFMCTAKEPSFMNKVKKNSTRNVSMYNAKNPKKLLSTYPYDNNNISFAF